MNYYRSAMKNAGSGDFSAEYTGTINGTITDSPTLAHYYEGADFYKDIINCQIIGANVRNVSNMYERATNIPNICFEHDNVYLNTSSMFFNTNNTIKNVFFRRSMNGYFNGQYSNLFERAISFTAMTNGYYNTAYNIYCYYNYSG